MGLFFTAVVSTFSFLLLSDLFLVVVVVVMDVVAAGMGLVVEPDKRLEWGWVDGDFSATPSLLLRDFLP